MADYGDQNDSDKPDSFTRLETDDDDGDDLNPEDDMDDDADDIDDGEEDVEIETHTELDESGRDDDDDDEMDVTDYGDNDEQEGDVDEDDDVQNKDDNVAPHDAPDYEASTSPVRSETKRNGASTSGNKQHPRKGMKGPRGGGNRKQKKSSNSINGRSPSVLGLTIPFRTIKKSMKLDPDIPIVQNEAAIMATVAVELFLKSLVTQSHKNAKNRGRNTIRYEDVAEARTNDKALAFLETLLP